MNPERTKILNALPAPWHDLWGEPLTTRCADCDQRETFTELGKITAALSRPCSSCGAKHVDAFDSGGVQMSVLCGNHGSAIGVMVCKCVVDFFVKDGSLGSALLIPKADAPVTCESCTVAQQDEEALDLEHTALICLCCLISIIRNAQGCGVLIYVVDHDGTQMRWKGTADGGALIESAETKEIDVRDVVDVHCVIPATPGGPFDYHTHGLMKFGHPEFQALAPGYCRTAILTLLLNHADQVINAGKRFAAGTTVNVDGIVCAFEETTGDAGDDGPRLRIVDAPGGCKCDACEAEDTNNGRNSWYGK